MSRSNQSLYALKSPISSEKRKANRLNALKSTGPKTPEGKQRSSRNASTHGIFSQHLVLPGESQERFDALREELIAEHRPRTVTELFLVERMAQTMWRMTRLQAAEAASHASYVEEMKRLRSRREAEAMTTEQNMVNILAAAPGESSVLEKLHRYEKRLEGTLHRSLRELRKLRTPVNDEEPPGEPSPYQADLESEEQEVPDETGVTGNDENLQNEPNETAECPSAGFETAEKTPFFDSADWLDGLEETGLDGETTHPVACAPERQKCP